MVTGYSAVMDADVAEGLVKDSYSYGRNKAGAIIVPHVGSREKAGVQREFSGKQEIETGIKASALALSGAFGPLGRPGDAMACTMGEDQDAIREEYRKRIMLREAAAKTPATVASAPPAVADSAPPAPAVATVAVAPATPLVQEAPTGEEVSIELPMGLGKITAVYEEVILGDTCVILVSGPNFKGLVPTKSEGQNAVVYILRYKGAEYKALYQGRQATKDGRTYIVMNAAKVL